MANLRDIKKRIKSINNTSKVTHAMELVSAAKMRKAQESALSSRPYTNTLNEILERVKAQAHKKGHELLATHKESLPLLVILLSTDRGLVGGLNINLFREISKQFSTNIKYVVVGKKGTNFAAKTTAGITASFVSDEKTPLEIARTLTKIAADAYMNGEVSKVLVVYPDFQSTIKQVPTVSQVLPINLELSSGQEHVHPVEDLLFEPTPDVILENLLPHYVLTKIYQAVLETKASEHSARMVAMKNATDAASDLVSDLTLTYNQARQEAITKELLDIVTAQSAFQ